MSFAVIAIVLVVLAVGLLLAWRTIRLFLKLVLVSALLLAVLLGVALWRWQARAPAPRNERPASAPARRTR
ncbi:MAG TPA: hypothetical protein VF525_10165 [Pyrinomonadaceae bacterium]|jgi:membrane protein implicated in regulation of membrane protease activity